MIRETFTNFADEVADRDHSIAVSRSSSLESTGGGLESVGGAPPKPLRAVRGASTDMAEIDLDTVNERAIFTNDLLPIGFLSNAAVFGRSVCRLLVTRFEGGERRISLTGRVKRYFGTGWLIGASHVITNHHVVNGREDGEPDAPKEDLELQSKSAEIQFDFDTDDSVPEKHTVAELAHANKDLDYAILKLTAASGRPAAPLWSREVNLTSDEVIPVNIIQHPGGAPKQIGMRNNLIAKVTEKNLAYFTDTKGGSSGSPVCNDVWQVVALHKAATRTLGTLKFQGKDTKWVNIGTRIDRIIADLRENQEDLWNDIAPRL